MEKIRLGFAGLRHNHIFALYELAISSRFVPGASPVEAM